MNIFINGENFTVENSTVESVSSSVENNPSVECALKMYLTEQQAQSSYAVALNGQFVSKAQYDSAVLNEKDALDVLFPIVGG